MRLRAVFDPGSGVLLWAGDAASRARWTSDVDLVELGLPGELQREAAALAARYDALFDFSDPANSAPLSRPEGPQLLADARAWLAQARASLGAAYEISDELAKG